MSDSAPTFEVPPPPAPGVPDRTIAFTNPAAADAANSGFDLTPLASPPPPKEAADPDATTDYKALPPPMPRKSGRELPVLGGFEVLEKIGHGGMGAVFRAKQLSTGKEVALKVLSRQLAENKTYVARFYREAQVMRQLEHPHIINCYAVGESDGLHYLAMEYVDGGTLQQALDRVKKMSLGDALHVTLACAYALEHAHERNLIHRDIKPENVLITRTGVVKLADLGLAKPMDDDMALTRSGVGAGTPQFMAPEQMRNARDVNGQADIYAMGCMLYYMAAGCRPFRAESLLQLIELKESTKFTPLHEHCPEAPPELERIIRRMLVRSLSARYASISTVIDDLERLGLANAKLSFIGQDAAPLPKSARIKTAGPVVPGASGRFQGATASGKFKAPGAGKMAVPTGEIWYVCTELLGAGKRRVKKMTAGQIIEQLQQQTFSPATEISRHVKHGYVAVQTYPEFADHCPRAETPAPPPPRATHAPQRHHTTQVSHWEEPQPSFMRQYGGLVIAGILFLMALAGVAVVIGMR